MVSGLVAAKHKRTHRWRLAWIAERQKLRPHCFMYLCESPLYNGLHGLPERGSTRLMAHPFSDLLQRSQKPSRTVVGLMSGTSADSIDAAVCRMHGAQTRVRVELLHYREHAHDAEVKLQLLRVADLDVRAIAEL